MNENRSLRKAGIFVVLTFALSWLIVGVYLGLGGRWVAPWAAVIAVVFMFMPMVSAIIVQKVIYREGVIGPLNVNLRPNRWFFVAWLLPPVIAVAALGVSLLFPDVTYDLTLSGFFERYGISPEQAEQMREMSDVLPFHPIWLVLIQGLIAGITINAIAGFGEELGWRGLLLKELRHLGFWRMSAVIGLIWGVWHAPIILQGHNYPQNPQIGVFMMIGWTILLSPIFTYITIRAGSVIAAAVLHGTLNGTLGLAIMLVRGGTDLQVGATGLAGFIVLIVLNILLLLYDRHLTREPIAAHEYLTASRSEGLTH